VKEAALQACRDKCKPSEPVISAASSQPVVLDPPCHKRLGVRVLDLRVLQTEQGHLAATSALLLVVAGVQSVSLTQMFLLML